MNIHADFINFPTHDDLDEEELVVDDTPVYVPPKRNPVALPAWDQRLVVDVCLGVDEDAVLEAHSITAHQLGLLLNDAVFVAAVARLKEELQKDGMSFKLKCRLQAEAMLEENWRLAHDEGTDPRVKERLIANTVRWAGYDTPAQAGNSGTGFSIAINFNADGAPKGVTLDHEPD